MVPSIFPDNDTDSFTLSAKGTKYCRSEVFIRDFSSTISSLTFSVNLLNELAESAIRPNLEMFIILLSQLIKAELSKMFCMAMITELLIFFTEKPHDSLNPRL